MALAIGVLVMAGSLSKCKHGQARQAKASRGEEGQGKARFGVNHWLADTGVQVPGSGIWRGEAWRGTAGRGAVRQGKVR